MWRARSVYYFGAYEHAIGAYGRYNKKGTLMAAQHPVINKRHRIAERPPFERIALLLQGGGALGSYQVSVYQALAEAGLHPDWVARHLHRCHQQRSDRLSNPPERRVEALRSFWETVTAPAHGFPTLFSAMLGAMGFQGDFARGLLNQAHAFATLMDGAAGFFRPRPVPPFFSSA